MKNEGNQVYCKQCTPKYEKIEYKSIKCADCGDEVWINSKSTKTCRCEECQEKANKESKKRWWNNNKEQYLN